MKKSSIASLLTFLMLITSCGKSSVTPTGTASTLEPVKPSTTYSDPDEADKDEGNTSGNEPVIVESSPYTQEELYFGNRIFGKDFLEVNAVEAVDANKLVQPRTVDFTFKPTSFTQPNDAPIAGSYYNGLYRPFSLVTEEETFFGSSAKPSFFACDDVGGLYYACDQLSNNGYYSVIDGFGNRLLDTKESSTFGIKSAEFKTIYLAHNEDDPCIPLPVLEMSYYTGSYSNEFSQIFLYAGAKYLGTHFQTSMIQLCPNDGQHQGNTITDLEMVKIPLDQYGKKDWYYTNHDGHYRFNNEENKIVSAISVNFDSSVSEYSTAWFSANHLNIQVAYTTDDKHNYTFMNNGTYYNVVNYIFEYTTGKTYQVKNLNYVVLSTADMKYSNTYFDFVFANLRFISNKVLLQHTYSFLVDKDLVLRDDVTDLIDSQIYKTKNYYYSRPNEGLSLFNKDGKHTLFIKKESINSLYPASEMLSYNFANGAIGLVNFGGTILFNADFRYIDVPSNCDGYRYIPAITKGNNNLYFLDLEEMRRIPYGEIYPASSRSILSGYFFVDDKSANNYEVIDLQTLEPLYILSASVFSKHDPFVVTKSGRGLYSNYYLYFDNYDSGGYRVIKFGEKLIVD